MAKAGSKWSDLAGQLLRFGFSTLISASFSLGLPMLLREAFGMDERLAVAIGFAAAYVMNLVLLRSFVFRSEGSWRHDIVRYVLTNGAFRLAEYGAFLLLFDLAGLDYRLAVLIVLGVSAVIKFFAYRFIFTRPERSSLT